MPTIAEAEAQIRADNRPVLFLDTCIYLDHHPGHGSLPQGFVAVGFGFARPAHNGSPRCTLVAASMIPTEWKDNAQKVRDDVNGNLAKIQERSRMFHEAWWHSGISPGFGRPFYAGVGLIERLHDLSKELLDRSDQLGNDSQSTLRGVDRVRHKIPPSKQGGEVKDCVIVEEIMETHAATAGQWLRRQVRLLPLRT